MSQVDLSIIIVSWNVADLLTACLDSIYANHPPATDSSVEIIVVDSASHDSTVEMTGARYPDVKLLAQEENVGFSRGNNIGLETAQGRYLFLLNPDTEIIGNAIQQMIDYLDANSDVGIIGPHTLNTDGSTQSTRRRFPSKQLAFFESTWLQPLAPQSLLDDFYVTDVPDHATADVDWVQGSALMARREVYEEIGGLDAGFVMYSEELDWCKRAKDAGWRVVYFGGAQITHHGGKSSEQASAFKHIHFQKSKIRYYRKHHSGGFAKLLRLFLLANYVWQLALESAKSLIGHRRDLRRERIKTYWQVLRSGLKAN
jgi:hypothetical protein